MPQGGCTGAFGNYRSWIRQWLLTLHQPPPRSAKFPALAGWGIHLVLVALARGCLSPFGERTTPFLRILRLYIEGDQP